MKLAEALAIRSDASRRFEQLRSRAQANATAYSVILAYAAGSVWGSTPLLTVQPSTMHQ